MQTLGAATVLYFQKPSRKRAVCLSLTRPFDDLTVRGTSWDEDLEIGDESPADIYYSTSGGAVSDLDSAAALNVDNAEIKANFDAITTDDLQAGLWNAATYTLFVVDPDAPSNVRIASMGGTLGQITIDRLEFLGELRGAMQRLQQTFGDVIGPCPYNFGDPATCKRSLVDRTVTGTADSVSADGLTWRDSARAEAGPSGSVAIDDIESVGSGEGAVALVTTASALGLPEGSTVTLSVVGPTLLSGTWQIHNPSGPRFELFIDISDTGIYPAFVSGTATPAGAESGYFDYGLFTLTSGANAGITREVKSYIPGQWTLQQSFPFAVTGTETYRMIAGCDKLPETCRVKHNNFANYGGEPFVPGIDRMSQVGRTP